MLADNPPGSVPAVATFTRVPLATGGPVVVDRFGTVNTSVVASAVNASGTLKFDTTTMGAAVLNAEVVPSSSRYPALSVSPGSFPLSKTRARSSVVAVTATGVPAVNCGEVETGTAPVVV